MEPLIRRKLESVPDVDVLLYAPEGAPAAADMPSEEPKPAMTAGRAALIAVMAQYARHAMADPSLIETQKLTYFMQAAGEPLRLNFVGHHYGPYADNLRHVLKLLEGHYVTGFGDGSSPVQEAEPPSLLPGAEAEATLSWSNTPRLPPDRTGDAAGRGIRVRLRARAACHRPLGPGPRR